MSKIAAITLTASLTLLAGVTGYAADKVALSCSGIAHHSFWSLKGEQNDEDYPYHDSLTIDLDGLVVIWGSDTYPITQIGEDLITFKGEAVDQRGGPPPVTWNHYTLGVMDRVTGDLSLTQNDKCEDLGRWHKTTFVLHCKPVKPFFQIP